MLLYLTNRDSEHLFPENTPTNFRVHLPLSIKGKCCYVRNCYLSSKPSEPLFLKCDFVQASIIDGRLQPILCMLVNKNTVFDALPCTQMKDGVWTTLQLQLVNRGGKTATLKGPETHIVLEITEN